MIQGEFFKKNITCLYTENNEVNHWADVEIGWGMGIILLIVKQRANA